MVGDKAVVCSGTVGALGMAACWRAGWADGGASDGGREGVRRGHRRADVDRAAATAGYGEHGYPRRMG